MSRSERREEVTRSSDSGGRNMKTYHLGGLVLAAGLTLAACNVATPQSSGSGGYATGMSSPQSAPTTVQAAQSKLGMILVDAQGRTLYAFTNDANGSPTCNGACANAWPPVAADSATTPGPGLNGALFSKATPRRRLLAAQGRQVAGVPLRRRRRTRRRERSGQRRDMVRHLARRVAHQDLTLQHARRVLATTSCRPTPKTRHGLASHRRRAGP